jgi:hypothetical protein
MQPTHSGQPDQVEQDPQANQIMTEGDLIEALAGPEHASWAHWMTYLFSQCTHNADGSLTIPADLVSHWQRQIDTDYADLTEREKDSDRQEVFDFLPIIRTYVDGLLREAAAAAEVTSAPAEPEQPEQPEQLVDFLTLANISFHNALRAMQRQKQDPKGLKETEKAEEEQE